MRTLLAKALLLIAVLLMPFGMSEAAAAPAHGTTHAAMALEHCADKAPSHHDRGGIVDCTMACAVALPAAALAHYRPLKMAPQLLAPATARQLDGLHPETATPPPRLS